MRAVRDRDAATRGADAPLLWAVYLTALAVRIAAAVVLDGFRHPQVQEYDAIARNMLAGRGFTFEQLGVVYHSYIAPLPAWLSAASYWIAGSLAPAMAVQIAAGALIAPVTAAVTRRLFGGRLAPLIAGLLVAVHPGLVLYTSGKLHALAFDALFFTLALLQSFRLAARPSPRQALLLGLIVGVGAFSRGTIVVFLPITAAWMLLTAAPPQRRRTAALLLLAGVCAAAVIAPWSIRNTRLQGRFVWLLTTDSEVFWRGNNPYASGTSYADDRHIILEMLPPDEMRDLVSQRNELAQADWFAARSHAFIRDHPAAFVQLTMKKFWYFWWFSPQMGLNYPRSWFTLYELYYVTVLLAAFAGMWWAFSDGRDRRRLTLLLVTYLLALSGLQSLYYVEGRHRWAVEPMLLALSAGGLAACVHGGRRRRDDVPDVAWQRRDSESEHP